MNKQQFLNVRRMLGWSRNRMAIELGVRQWTVAAWEGNAPLLSEAAYYKSEDKLNHLIAFACAWMLLNGGAIIPWPRSEDGERLKSFRDYHGMANDQLAALLDLKTREIRYLMKGETQLSRYRLMALCWMRIFGSSDPFAFPLAPKQDGDVGLASPMRLRPANVDRFARVIES